MHDDSWLPSVVVATGSMVVVVARVIAVVASSYLVWLLQVVLVQ